MNNQRLTCYYSVVRFCPYPETDEFVNVGIILSCPGIGFLDFKRARKRLARVSAFFPELNPQVFSAAVQSLHDTLTLYQSAKDSDQLLTDVETRKRRDEFFALVRPRETILFFSEPRVIMSNSPAETLINLYSAYVDRQFAHVVEYQEKQMCRRLEVLLASHNLLTAFERDKAVGDEHYRINFPFVSYAADRRQPQRAIKALHLDKEEPTDIFKHADSWCNSVRRLRDFGTAPERLLFVIHPPQNDRPAYQDAFARVLGDFAREAIPISLETQSELVLKFAQS